MLGLINTLAFVFTIHSPCTPCRPLLFQLRLTDIKLGPSWMTQLFSKCSPRKPVLASLLSQESTVQAINGLLWFSLRNFTSWRWALQYNMINTRLLLSVLSNIMEDSRQSHQLYKNRIDLLSAFPCRGRHNKWSCIYSLWNKHICVFINFRHDLLSKYPSVSSNFNLFSQH